MKIEVQAELVLSVGLYSQFLLLPRTIHILDRYHDRELIEEIILEVRGAKP